jgi:hypothetical protein
MPTVDSLTTDLTLNPLMPKLKDMKVDVKPMMSQDIIDIFDFKAKKLINLESDKLNKLNPEIPLQKYAKGGIARTPQLAMFGEGSRPEAYVPLPDGRSIPVSMSGGGGNVNNISVNVSVDNKGGTQTQTQSADNTEEYSRRLGVAISNAVKQEMLNQQRPGGLLYKGRR